MQIILGIILGAVGVTSYAWFKLYKDFQKWW